MTELEAGAGEIIVRTCPECGLHCKGPSTYGLTQHKKSKHADSDWSPLDQEPHVIGIGDYELRKEEEKEKAREWREARQKAEEPYEAPAPSAPPRTDLLATERALAQNLEALGGGIAALLESYKVFVVTHPGAALRLSGQARPLPYLETTFGHVVAQQAPVTAQVIMGYAANNETLLRWVEGFNRVATGGAVGQVVASHAAGLAHTAMPTSPMTERAVSFLAPDALQRVIAENEALRQRVDELRRNAAAASAAAAAAA
jgi:hypothetical protein